MLLNGTGDGWAGAFTAIAAGAAAAQTSYVASRVLSHDALLLVGILFLIGLIVGLGHALSSREQLPLRRVIGKTLVSTAVATTASAVYFYRPETDALTVIGLGSILSVMGSGWFQDFVKSRTTIHKE